MSLSIAIRNPELVLGSGHHEGFQWLVVHNQIGYRCGYVRIPKGHPWHGLDHEDVKPYPDVHGGFTFAEADTPCDQPGEDDAWWLGFDCAHGGDAPDPTLPGYCEESARLTFGDEVIRTQEYVERECRSLCKLAANAA